MELINSIPNPGRMGISLTFLLCVFILFFFKCRMDFFLYSSNKAQRGNLRQELMGPV